MKRTLLACNAKLYAIMTGISLLWVGFKFGVKFQINEFNNYWDTSYPVGCFLFPVVYLILLRIGLYLEEWREYASGKGCYAMAIFTLGFSALYWGLVLIYRFPDLQDGIEYKCLAENIAFPAILFFFSVIISVLYFVCAVQIRRALKKPKLIAH